MKLQELRKKTIVDLNKLLQENREVIRELRFKVTNKQLKNIRQIREAKKLQAKIMTILSEKKILEENKKL